MWSLFKNRAKNKLRLSIFGLDAKGHGKSSLTNLLGKLEGVASSKVDEKRNIAEISLIQGSKLTKNEILKAIFSVGLAAEELG